MNPKNFINRLLDNYAQKRLFGYGPTDDWSYVDQFTGPAKDIKLLGMYSGITYRCIDMIATATGGKYRPTLFTTDMQGKITTTPVHPFLTLLKKPNPDLSQYQLFEGSASFVEQFGEFFWYMVPGSLTGFQLSGPKQIYLLRPDRMGITLDKDTGEILGYTYNAGVGNTKIPFEPEEILHHMTFNPRNPYRGYSTVEAAIDYIQTEEEVSRFTRNYFRNNAAMSGVLNVNGKVSKTAWQKFVRQWRERYEGVDNAGKVALVRDSQVQFTQIGSNLNDMNMSDLKETTVEQIMMMFKIPKGLFGMEADAGLGRASVETLEYIFAKWTMDDKFGRLDDTLQRAMDRYFAKDGLEVGHMNIIPDDKVFDLQVKDKGVDRWITRKEIRAADPLTANTEVEGDDQLFVANTMLPLNDAMTSDQAAAKPININPTPPAKDDDDKDPKDPDDDEDSDKSVRLVPKKKELEIEQKEAFRLELQEHASEYAKKYNEALTKVLDKQEQTALSNIQHLGSKALADVLFAMSEENANFSAELMPILLEMGLQQGQLALIFSGDKVSKYELSQAIQNALQHSTSKMVSNFNQETLDELNDTLTEGVQDGEGLDKLSARVSDVYKQAKDWRTERVARTESQGAANAATVDAYKQNPVVTAMTWFANPGACQYCDALDGTTVGLETSFVKQGDSVDVSQDDGSTQSYQADYGDVNNPPLHPNCSCTIIPVTDAN